MTTKRKISIRKVLQVLVTLIVTTGCVLAILSASKIQNNKNIAGIQIHIKNENACRFIDQQEVQDMLLSTRHIDLLHTPASRLDLRKMEEIAQSSPWIADAQVYVDNRRMLQVYVTQRIPVLRVFEQNGNSYYLDTALKAVPLSDRYTHYTPVVTNVPELKDDSISRDLKAQMLKVVQTVDRDTFWNAQVQEIALSNDRMFQLVPVLGNHRILIGDSSKLTDKLANLFLFYQKVLNRIGWDKYQVLDARFEGQVVASPSLPWKAPRDKAMSDMNWVKSILGDAAEQDRKEGTVPQADAIVPGALPVAVPVASTQPQASVQAATATQAPTVPQQPKPEQAAVARQTPANATHIAASKPAASKPAQQVVKQPETAHKPSQQEKTHAPPAKPKPHEQAIAKKPAAAAPDKPKKNENDKQKKTETRPKYIYQGNNTH
jgi:cell division protein FtsQ